MKRGSKVPQHSKHEGKATRPSQEATRYQRKGPVKQQNWARTPHESNRGGGGREATTNHHKPQNREPKCTQRPQRGHKQNKRQTNKQRETNNGGTQKDPSKNRTRNHPEGKESTALRFLVFFCGRRQLAFAWSPHFEAYLRTSGELNLQKVPQPSKPTWVSVQDVVLNSLRPSTQPSQPLPELSHFYTTTSNKGTYLAHVAMVV